MQRNRKHLRCPVLEQEISGHAWVSERMLTKVPKNEKRVGTLPRVRILESRESQCGDPKHDGRDYLQDES